MVSPRCLRSPLTQHPCDQGADDPTGQHAHGESDKDRRAAHAEAIGGRIKPTTQLQRYRSAAPNGVSSWLTIEVSQNEPEAFDISNPI